MCDKRLVGSVIECIQCKKTVERSRAIIYNKNKHESCNSNECFPTKPCDNQSVKYIWEECDSCILGNVLCICCVRNVKRTSVVLFKKEKYDFENSMVSKLLLHVSGNSLNEKIYIYKTCHQNLHTRTGGESKIPKVLVPKQHSAAQKFLTAIQQKPEFVCTCCH